MQESTTDAPSTVSSHEKPTDRTHKWLLATWVFDLTILSIIVLHREIIIRYTVEICTLAASRECSTSEVTARCYINLIIIISSQGYLVLGWIQHGSLCAIQ